MTRTIQTARILFPSAFTKGPDAIPLHIWPDLREANDGNCNTGRSRVEMQVLHSGLDFAACDEEWNYKAHRFEDAADRAAAVRKDLMKLPGPHIVVVGHRGFIAYLVDTKQTKFRNCGAFFFLSSSSGPWLLDLTRDYQKFAPTDLRTQKNWRNVAMESTSFSVNMTLVLIC
jgi:Histidine phosphatase superfamily (branch 1)